MCGEEALVSSQLSSPHCHFSASILSPTEDVGDSFDPEQNRSGPEHVKYFRSIGSVSTSSSVILWSSLHLVIFSGPKESMIFCFSIVGWLLIVFRGWNLIYLYLFGKSRHCSCSCIYCKWKFSSLEHSSSNLHWGRWNVEILSNKYWRLLDWASEACAWLLTNYAVGSVWRIGVPYVRQKLLYSAESRWLLRFSWHSAKRCEKRYKEEKPLLRTLLRTRAKTRDRCT